MNVNFQNQNKQSTFGMALHMNEAKIERKLGKDMAKSASNVRSMLENLANDCDIYVKPRRVDDPRYDTFNVIVRKGLFKSRKSSTITRGSINPMSGYDELASSLLNTANQVKNSF